MSLDDSNIYSCKHELIKENYCKNCRAIYFEKVKF